MSKVEDGGGTNWWQVCKYRSEYSESISSGEFTIIRYYCAATPLKPRCDFLSVLKKGKIVNIFLKIITMCYVQFVWRSIPYYILPPEGRTCVCVCVCVCYRDREGYR